MDAYHNRMAAHLLSTTCPEEFAKGSDNDWDMARLPDSTWSSTVRVFKQRYTVQSTSGDDVSLYFGKKLASDIQVANGTIDGAGTPLSVVPAAVRVSSFMYRRLGFGVKFTPTVAQDTMAGEIGCLSFIPPTQTFPTTLSEVRAYPWAWSGKYSEGAHLDMAHGSLAYEMQMHIQGGAIATGYDAIVPFKFTDDPDVFDFNDGAGVLGGNINQNNTANWTLPVSAISSQAHTTSELMGVGVMVIEGAGQTAGATLGTIDVIRIIEMSVPSQVYKARPISAPLFPSSIKNRNVSNAIDLSYIANKSVGALGWLGKNWRGIAQKTLDVVDVGTSLGSVAGVPGLGAADGVVDFLRGVI